VIYSLGLRISEGLPWKARHRRVSQRTRAYSRWQGRQRIAYSSPMPAMTLEAMRRFLDGLHRHPRFLLFPSPAGSQYHRAESPVHGWMPAALQAAIESSSLECGIEKRLTVHSARARYRHRTCWSREWTCASSSPWLGHSRIATPQARLRHIPRLCPRSHRLDSPLHNAAEAASSCAGWKES